MPDQKCEQCGAKTNGSVSDRARFGAIVACDVTASSLHAQRLQGKVFVARFRSVVARVLVALLLTAIVACNRKSKVPEHFTLSPQQLESTTALAEKGQADAQRILGTAYAKGEGVKQDYQQAAKWYQQSAAQGNGAAQAALGELFEAGQGVSRDYSKAADFYRRAAEQGISTAQYDLAALYAVGRGVPLNNAEALRWYLKAANQNDSLAQYNVGMRYFEGHGVAPDPVLGYKWLKLASDQGLPDAAQALKTLKASMSPDQMSKAKDLIREYTSSQSGKSPSQ